MSGIVANLGKSSYYAVIFSSVKNKEIEGYSEMAERMWALAHEQPGFLGVDSASSDISITVSYWESLEAIKKWKSNSEHRIAQQYGRDKWYKCYTLRIAKIEREYDFGLV